MILHINSLVVLILSLALSTLTFYLTSRRVLSLPVGLIGTLFWVAVGFFSIYRSPLHQLMAYMQMINFTNFLLLGVFFVVMNLLFFLHIASRKQKFQIDQLTQELAMLRFEVFYRDEIETTKSKKSFEA